jgi:hypothetical protein
MQEILCMGRFAYLSGMPAKLNTMLLHILGYFILFCCAVALLTFCRRGKNSYNTLLEDILYCVTVMALIALFIGAIIVGLYLAGFFNYSPY